jgi:predicted Rossmann fold nucleotide-binding protein DprA/Smf involved in DNA uptake
MAVPGNITSNLSQGTNWLIKTGAKLVESWEDVAEEFASPLKEQLLSQKKEEKEKPPSRAESLRASKLRLAHPNRRPGRRNRVFCIRNSRYFTQTGT